MSRKKRKRELEDLEMLQQALNNNGRAIDEGPRKKKWTHHDLRDVKPLTPAQEEMFHAFFNGYNICAHGSAGTGKTYLSLWLAFNEIFKHDNKFNHIIIVRSAVPTRELGFMPGDLEEKVALYEMPYKDMLASLFGRFSTYDDMKEVGIIRFLTTSFVRGLTWDNAIVIVDEGQNCTLHELNSIITRLGNNSRILVTGDMVQTDLNGKKNEQSGFDDFIRIVKDMKEFSSIEFNTNDIVRSKFVKSWIIALQNYKLKKV